MGIQLNDFKLIFIPQQIVDRDLLQYDQQGC